MIKALPRSRNPDAKPMQVLCLIIKQNHEYLFDTLDSGTEGGRGSFWRGDAAELDHLLSKVGCNRVNAIIAGDIRETIRSCLGLQLDAERRGVVEVSFAETGYQHPVLEEHIVAIHQVSLTIEAARLGDDLEIFQSPCFGQRKNKAWHLLDQRDDLVHLGDGGAGLRRDGGESPRVATPCQGVENSNELFWGHEAGCSTDGTLERTDVLPRTEVPITMR